MVRRRLRVISGSQCRPQGRRPGAESQCSPGNWTNLRTAAHFMKCPHCLSENFADAIQCRNCDAPLEVPPDTSKKWIYFAWGVGFLVVGGMLIFALKQPTSVVKCTEFKAQIEAYESSPLWIRDKGTENWNRNRERRSRQGGSADMRGPSMIWSENTLCYASVPQAKK